MSDYVETPEGLTNGITIKTNEGYQYALLIGFDNYPSTEKRKQRYATVNKKFITNLSNLDTGISYHTLDEYLTEPTVDNAENVIELVSWVFNKSKEKLLFVYNPVSNKSEVIKIQDIHKIFYN